MATCFIIQPFDKGKFDKRYADVYRPAIEAAALDPYRVDQDASVEIPIFDIEKGIKNAAVCFAEISLDNPNVWFELGFAISAQKDVLIVCSKERTTFPFDVRHRNILTYDADSPSDFDKLKSEITERLISFFKKVKASPILPDKLIKDVAGLEPHELLTLASLAESMNGSTGVVPVHIIRSDVERNGFNKLAANMALMSLTEKELIEGGEQPDFHGHDTFYAYRLTAQGWNWLQSNRDKLQFRLENDVPF